MAQSNFSRFYPREDFTSLVGPVPLELLESWLLALTLTVPIAHIELTATHGARVQWQDIPSGEDIVAIDAAVASFAGGSTTSAPIELNSFAVSTTTSTTHAAKIDHTTPALDAGTYQVMWTSSLRMQAVAANTGVEGRMKITRSDDVSVEQTDAWDLNVRHAFNGGITFIVQAGQTLHVELTFARLGASGTAEMSGARVTIDQLSAATV